MLEIYQLDALTDNYIYVLRNPETQEVAVVDPSEAEPVRSFLKQRHWKLNSVLNTHHHWDHVGGNRALKKEYGCPVIGFEKDSHRIPYIDIALPRGRCEILGEKVDVLFIPGHTLGHVAYWFYENRALFCGDTLFTLGCGRLFEGSPSMMWESLCTLRELPKETRVYCGHEYTEINGAFALTIEPNNKWLVKRMGEVQMLRQHGKPTVPSTLLEELQTNPFLRPESYEIQESLGVVEQSIGSVFAEIRKRKDDFA